MGGHSSGVCSLVITSHGLLISGSWDSTIKVWTKQYNLLKTLNKLVGGHWNSVYSLAIKSDDVLISGSRDYTIKIWSKEYNLLKTLN